MTETKTPFLLRFPDLQARNIAKSWAQLEKMIETEDFPRGRKLSPQVRIWTDDEIADWLANRPTDKRPIVITENHISRQRRRKREQAKAVA